MLVQKASTLVLVDLTKKLALVITVVVDMGGRNSVQQLGIPVITARDKTTLLQYVFPKKKKHTPRRHMYMEYKLILLMKQNLMMHQRNSSWDL